MSKHQRNTLGDDEMESVRTNKERIQRIPSFALGKRDREKEVALVREGVG